MAGKKLFCMFAIILNFFNANQTINKMKHFRPLTTILAAILITTAAIFNACSKQETESPAKVENPQKDYTIYNKLSSFRTQMEFYKNNPTLKSNESVEVDSAIWLLEGAMNLTYGFPHNEYTDFESGEATIILQKDNEGRINYNELAAKYQQVIDEAREDYYNSGFEEKGLYVVILEITEETETDVTFMVETITGNLGGDNPSSPIFENWWYGENEGGCEGNNALFSDAAQELNNAYPQTELTEEHTLVGPIEKTITGGEPWLRRPNDVLDNEYDYYIFCASENVDPFIYDSTLCLLSPVMGQYYVYLDYVVQDLALDWFNIPSSHEFIRFTRAQGINPNQTEKYFHEFDCTFALKSDRPGNDPAIPL